MAQTFSSGIELAPFLTSSDLLRKSWYAITSRDEDIIQTVGEGLSWKLYREPGSDLTIIDFNVSQDSSNLQVDLVPSSALRDKKFHCFEFLCTKKDPIFSVNSTAFSLLYANYEKLDQLKSEINSSPSPRLIVTGVGLGGPIASLFTISLLDSIDLGKKRPLCITFGSPLVGDKKLQEAISRSSTWTSCFLHVVSLKDPLPRKLNPHTSVYMPFGTFLFCSDISSTCFEIPDSILEVLVGSINDQNQGFQPIEYGKIVESLYRKAICKDFSGKAEDLTHSNSLQASISLQFQALGLTPNVQQMKILESKIIWPKRKTFDQSKKLNMMKIHMAQLEWYKKYSKNQGIGYYDSFRQAVLTIDQDVVQWQKKLTNYWIEMVEQAEMNPQREGAAFRTRRLYAGTNYRRMVEPLDIAEYYRNGGKDYVTKQRSRHYILLEKWLEEDRENNPVSKGPSRRNVELLLTLDSCFWAHVEEALLLLQKVQSSVTEREEATRRLVEFEVYVYGLLKKYEVSPEIFLKDSSYMKWWTQYKGIMGTSYNSALAVFMSNPYHYAQYTEGAYDFP